MNKVAKITLSGVVIAGLAVGGLTYAGAQTGHTKDTPKAHYHSTKQESSKKTSSSSKSSSSKPSSSSSSSVSTTSASAVSSSQQAQQPAVSSAESQVQSSVSQPQQSLANNDYYTKPVDQYGHTQAERDAGGAGYDGACQASEDKYNAQSESDESALENVHKLTPEERSTQAEMQESWVKAHPNGGQ